MTTLAECRTGLAAAVTTGTGLRCEKRQRDTINAPEAHIVRKAMRPGLVMGSPSDGAESFTFAVRLFAPRTPSDQSQDWLESYCEQTGATSIRAAVENGSNWGAVTVDYARVVEIGETFVYATGPEPNSPTYLAVDIDVEVVF